MECKQSIKDLEGDKWTLGNLKSLSTKDFCIWDNSDRLAYNGDAYLVLDKYADL